MAVVPHNLVSLRGTFEDGGVIYETWSMNFRFSTAGTADEGQAPDALTQDQAEDLHDVYSDFHSNSYSKISVKCMFDHLRCYPIGADGKTTAAPILSTHDRIGGAVSGSNHPSQIALVATLVAEGLGKGRRGRVFIPGVCHGIYSDWLASTSDIAATLNQFKVLVDAMNQVGGATNSVLSIIGHTGAGTARVVHEVRMGRVLDTMRSRRTSLDESPQSLLVA